MLDCSPKFCNKSDELHLGLLSPFVPRHVDRTLDLWKVWICSPDSLEFFRNLFGRWLRLFPSCWIKILPLNNLEAAGVEDETSCCGLNFLSERKLRVWDCFKAFQEMFLDYLAVSMWTTELIMM